MIVIRRPSVVFFLLAAALMVPLDAAIPRETEIRLQAAAHEQLSVVITEVERKAVKRRGAHSFDIVATAKVLAVRKTGAGLKKDDIIELRYSMPDFDRSPEPGAWPSLVTKGARYKAFLRVSKLGEKVFEPAASSGSFEQEKGA